MVRLEKAEGLDMVQWMEAFAIKPHCLNSIPGTYVVEEIIFGLSFDLHRHTEVCLLSQISKQINITAKVNRRILFA